jgi:predicted Zn-dependent protease with MMP-like domain
MNTAQFEELVEQCLKDIPKKFRDLLENITIEVEPDEISVDKDRHLILGLYNGVPLPYRGPAYQGVLPDKIIIYQKAFDNYPASQLPALIKNVVMHEIGHYFGMSEEELEKYKRD